MESVDLGHLLDSRLEAAIEELRDKSETEIAQYKLEVEATYKDKVRSSLSLSLTDSLSLSLSLSLPDSFAVCCLSLSLTTFFAIVASACSLT